MRRKTILFSLSVLLSFAIPTLIVLSNVGYFLGFADAAEFALVTKIAGIAHPPGFPAYVLTGKVWSRLMEGFGIQHIKGMIWFSVFCTASASLLLHLTFCTLLKFSYPSLSDFRRYTICLIAALSFVTGVTAWHWSGNVEVYAFQVLSFAIMLCGLTNYNIQKTTRSLYIAALGISLGLANHHLTMIFFLPFVLLFFYDDLFSQLKTQPLSATKNAQQKIKKSEAKVTTIITIVKSRNFLLLAAITSFITTIFYGWMFVRAGSDLPFKFGNPDTLSRLFYHLSGGAWIENTWAEVKGLAGLRFPFFMNITFEQFLFFLPLLVMGIATCIKKKCYTIIYIAAGYYLLMLLYQLRIDQTADTDAYMLPAFFVLCIFIPIGIVTLITFNKKIIYILPFLLLAQLFINFPKTDKRKFNVNETLMREIDRCAPLNSTILIADWTTVIQYYYHRIAENFRPDLIVLNYDLKFTNYKMLEQDYPALYKDIKPEYDRFVELLGQAHPQEIYNTGCTLDNTQLMNSFLTVIIKIQQRSIESHTSFMCDPKTYIFLLQNNLMKNNAIVSGSLVSTTTTNKGEAFLDLDYAWLQSPLLMKEPSATDKMVDLEAALDFNKNYFKSLGNDSLFRKAEQSYERIKELQRKMKRNMPFVYRSR